MPFWRLFPLPLLLTLVVLAYMPGLSGGFLFDDEPHILLNDRIHLSSLDWPALLAAATSTAAGPLGRPIPLLSLALNHYATGLDPYWYKVTNLVIHLLNGVLAYFLSLRLLQATRLEFGARLLRLTAAVVAAAWLLHPIQLLPVLHVVQRMTSLSALFLFGAMLMHVEGRKHEVHGSWWLLVVAWGVLWPLSMLSKETGALFPLFALAYELIVRRAARGRLDGFARALAATVVLVTIGAAIYGLSPSGQWIWAGYDMRPFTLGERLLTESRVLWSYLGLMFTPHLEAFGLYHDDVAISRSAIDPWTTVPALLGLIALSATGWLARRSVPLVAFGIAWYLIGHALESTFLPLELVHEHRNYVPLLGLLIPMACGMALLAQRSGVRRTLAITLALSAIGYLTFLTSTRAHLFGDGLRLTQIEAEHHPNSPRTQYAAGLALVRATIDGPSNSPGRYFARQYYERAGELDAGFKASWLGLIHLNCLSGAKPEPVWIEELARRLRDTPFAPGDRNVLFNIKQMSVSGALCLERPEVEHIFHSALQNPTAAAPVRAIIHSWFGDYLMLKVRDLPAAQTELDRALALVPGNPSNRLKRAQLAYLQGRPDEAATTLGDLTGARLSHSEMTTYKELVACLDARDTSVTCIGK